MCAWIESKPARPTICKSDRVNILEKLALILRYARIFEACAIFEPRNVPPKHTRSASVQTTHEHILMVTYIVVLPNHYFHISMAIRSPDRPGEQS